MPLTFPSHAAAVLPLFHLPGARRLPPLALVIGSTTPDLIYLFNIEGRSSHEPLGLLTFCLPAGLVAMVYVEGLLRPVLGPRLALLLPGWTRLPRLLTSHAHTLPHHLVGWLWVFLALVIGAATHQLWDGFTHAWMWPARVLYPEVYVSLLGAPVLVSKVAQHTSSLVGATLVVLYLRHVSPAESAADLSLDLRPNPGRQLVRRMALPVVTSLVVGALWMLHPHPLFTRAIWDAAWAASTAFVVTLGLVCLVDRLRESRSAVA